MDPDLQALLARRRKNVDESEGDNWECGEDTIKNQPQRSFSAKPTVQPEQHVGVEESAEKTNPARDPSIDLDLQDLQENTDEAIEMITRMDSVSFDMGDASPLSPRGSQGRLPRSGSKERLNRSGSNERLKRSGSKERLNRSGSKERLSRSGSEERKKEINEGMIASRVASSSLQDLQNPEAVAGLLHETPASTATLKVIDLNKAKVQQIDLNAAKLPQRKVEESCDSVGESESGSISVVNAPLPDKRTNNLRASQDAHTCSNLLTVDEDVRVVGVSSNFEERALGLRASTIFLLAKEIKAEYEENGQNPFAKTTRDVQRRVLSKTRESKVSFVEQMYNDPQHKHLVEKAEWFISYSWDLLFTTFIETLIAHVEMNTDTMGNDPVLWIDIFCLNQHINMLSKPNTLLSVFDDTISRIKNVVMVTSPYENAETLTSGWRVYELLSSTANASTVLLAFPRRDKKMFLAEMKSDHTSWQKIVAAIDGGTARYQNEKEKEAITRAITAKGYTYVALDNRVKKVIREAVCNFLEKAAGKEAERIEQARTQLALGRLLNDLAYHVEATRVLEGCLHRLRGMQGRGGHDAIDAMLDLTIAYRQSGAKKEELRTKEEYALALAVEYGPSHSKVIGTRLELGHALEKEGRLAEALEHYLAVLEGQIREYGREDRRTQDTVACVGSLYCKLGKFELAGELYKENEVAPKPKRTGSIRKKIKSWLS
eukprot:CAMPEP_0181301994 /NCGR_PEP_ID=MMETSP1101-20121128/7727_1 /TAXON_ID=46948 /ORGANISM="Rhodomonas abbreviata, Strain Caron Lab Isolate" /LENGTH=714 /DNA_ID=CAMNT_0023407349 /DNA_START=22 /DNA_END=2166 /DNA_ORIENTATION=+